MTEENITPKKQQGYSEMLLQLVKEFDDQLPDELTFKDTLDIGVDAWNLANNKAFLVERNSYKVELKKYKNHVIINKMVDFKINNFGTRNNIILDYEMKENSIKVRSQTEKNHFESHFKQLISTKPD